MKEHENLIYCPKCHSTQLTAINAPEEILVCCIACGEKWKPSEYSTKMEKAVNDKKAKDNQNTRGLFVKNRYEFNKLYKKDKAAALIFAKNNHLPYCESDNVEQIYVHLRKQEVKEFITQLIVGTVFILIVILFFWMCTGNDNNNSDSKNSQYANPTSDIYKNPTEKWMSDIDGSIFDFEWKLKKTLHNPDSFEHVETSYKGDGYGEYVEVRMKYRAKNKLGALVLSTAKAVLNTNNGNVSGITIE